MLLIFVGTWFLAMAGFGLATRGRASTGTHEVWRRLGLANLPGPFGTGERAIRAQATLTIAMFVGIGLVCIAVGLREVAG